MNTQSNHVVNEDTLFAVFTAFNNAAVDVYTACAAEGLDTWALARPVAMRWAAKEYGLHLKEGQRGTTFVEDQDETNSARSALARLKACFEKPAGTKGNHATKFDAEAVAKRLFDRYTPKQCKEIGAALAKLLK